MERPTNYTREYLAEYLPERFYGNESQYRALVLTADTVSTTELTPPHLPEEDFAEAFEDVKRTLTVITDPKGGQ